MYVPRLNEETIFQSFRSSLITALLGPRRVGKSTLVQRFVQLHPEQKWILLNMDIRAERARIEADELQALIEERALQKIQPSFPLWVAIDEAQKCPALFEQIKVLYDRFKGTRAVKFILTGSGALSLHQSAAESLAGRIELLHLRGFGLQEACALKNPGVPKAVSVLDGLFTDHAEKIITAAVEEVLPLRQALQEALDTLLIWGGFPEVLALEQSERRISYLGDYIQTYLEKDIRALSAVSDLSLYEKIMEILAQQTGSTRDDQKLIEVLGCSRDTLKKYRGYLEATLIYQEIFPFIDSTLRRLIKSPKGYLTNNGLISYLTGIYDAGVLTKTGTIGHRLENLVLQELQIALDRHPERGQIYFWRTSGHVEVDFVVARPPQILPVEVTHAVRPDRKKKRHLEQFLKQETRASFGVYVYNGPLQIDRQAKIIYLPAWTLG